MSRIAILTGDIVNSTKLTSPDLDSVMHQLEATSADLRQQNAARTLKFSRVSGDGWQIALAPQALALRLALGLRATLMSGPIALDTRISIAVGAAPVTLPDNLNAASGAVFTASGRALARIEDPFRMRHASDPRLDALAIALDALLQELTANQAAVLCHLLKDPEQTQSGIAQQMGKSKQAVSKSLKAAKADAILTALTLIESGTDD